MTSEYISPFWEHISLKVTLSADGKSEVTIPVQKEVLNFGGNVQGGVIATLIDVATGSAVASILSEGQKIVTTDLTIHYVLPGQGKMLTGKGHIKHKGRTLAVANGEVFNDAGQLIALGSASFRIIE
ncbi:PaaI family thioesterase [Lysinibacillus endophyticus]|uniref:PaaI family thioesterase n=1 Tax=Ureibacillus endophyticus TaxID=1978490 RepID=UPI00209C80A6|nr:PaaI family thioesterase [Lysinibacillus endophyticus]MCP1146712.1 PaaI family thioesterase [Lysinibacillus endophyticus]